MNSWHFLHPHLLWLLCVVLILMIVRIVTGRKRSFDGNIQSEMAPYLIHNGVGKEVRWRLILPLLAIAMGIMALSGPAQRKWEEKEVQPDIAVTAVVNLSDKMDKGDISTIKVALYGLLDSLRHEQVALVAQGGSSHILIPFTTDYRLVKSYLEWLSPDIMPHKGDRLGTVVSKIRPDEESDYHVVLYFTPDIDKKRLEEWNSLEFESDARYVIATKVGSTIQDSTLVQAGIGNNGLTAVLGKVRDEAQGRMDDRKDESVWEDYGVQLCWMATILLLPLFLRYRKGLMALLPLLVTLTSCHYTCEKWDVVQTEYYLLKGDTMDAIAHADNPFMRGRLWTELGNTAEAAVEYARDSSHEAMYNAALATFQSGRYTEGLRMFRELHELCPDWQFVDDNIKMIEKWLSEHDIEEIAGDSISNKSKTDTDSFEEDEDRVLDGSEEEIWADRLDVDGDHHFNYSREPAKRKSEILFRQIDNNPEEFLKRRLLYEYTHEK